MLSHENQCMVCSGSPWAPLECPMVANERAMDVVCTPWTFLGHSGTPLSALHGPPWILPSFRTHSYHDRCGVWLVKVRLGSPRAPVTVRAENKALTVTLTRARLEPPRTVPGRNFPKGSPGRSQRGAHGAPEMVREFPIASALLKSGQHFEKSLATAYH